MTGILVTGFEPFNGMNHNPSQVVLEALPDKLPSGTTLIRTLLQVDRHAGPQRAIQALDEYAVDAVVGMGVALAPARCRSSGSSSTCAAFVAHVVPPPQSFT